MRVLSSGAAFVLLLALAGCTALPPAATPTPAANATGAPATPSPTPTIEVGPVALTEEQAAERYLGIVCQRNSVINQLNDAISGGEEAYLNGGNPPVSEINRIAKETMRVVRASVEVADDDYYMWPTAVVDAVKKVRDSQVAEASTLSSLANAKSFEDAYYTRWPDQSEASAASQEVRYQLGINPDTEASCVGFESATDELHKTMTERREYLSSFASTE